MSDKYLTTREVGDLIGASPSAVLKWIDKGRLRAHRTPGGHRRVARADLVKFLSEHGMPVPAKLYGVGRLLIIDDDPIFLRTARRAILRHAPGLEVETATGAASALIKIGVAVPDAVLLDVYMPGLDGIELCQTLQEMPETKHIVVVAVSGRPSRQVRIRFEKAGAIAFFKKPLDVRGLLDVLGVERTPAPSPIQSS